MAWLEAVSGSSAHFYINSQYVVGLVTAQESVDANAALDKLVAKL